MATHSSILAWKIPWTEESGGAAVPGVAKSGTRLSTLLICCSHPTCLTHPTPGTSGQFPPHGQRLLSCFTAVSALLVSVPGLPLRKCPMNTVEWMDG